MKPLEDITRCKECGIRPSLIISPTYSSECDHTDYFNCLRLYCDKCGKSTKWHRVDGDLMINKKSEDLDEVAADWFILNSEWYDTIDWNKYDVLCYVSDKYKVKDNLITQGSLKMVQGVCPNEPFKFVTIPATNWKFAEPLTRNGKIVLIEKEVPNNVE